MASAQEYAGIALGASQFGDWLDAKPERDARRKEAENRARLSQVQLEEYKRSAPVRQAQQDNDLARLQADTYKINSAMSKQQSYDSFDRYQVDGDTRHLNNWLNSSNPITNSITKGMIRFDKPVRDKDTESMLRESGIVDIEGFFSSPELVNSYVVGTMEDGSKSLVDMTRLYAATNYDTYARDQQLADINATSSVMMQLRQGTNLTDIQQNSAIVGSVAEATGLPRAEVFNLLREEPQASRSGGTAVERVAQGLRESDPNLGYRDSLAQAVDIMSSDQQPSSNEERFVQDYLLNNPGSTREEGVAAYRQAGRDSRTAGQKNAEFAEEAKVSLDKMFGGSFLDADLNDLTSKQQAEMSNYINRLEQVGGLELTNEEKKIGRNVRRLLSLGSQVGESLTPEQTGLLDSTLNYFKKFVSDNVEGKEATVAYENFRAIGRNALFGSQVSASDYKAFDKAFASLGQQTGPVLASLKGQLSLIREDLVSMTALNDPYVTKARFGVTLEEADRIIDALDERIDIINRVAAGKPVQGLDMPVVEPQVKVTTGKTGERPPLGSFFQ